MMLHSDLLTQAEQLATREPRRPKQASLRRAVSAAYYALFHLLTYEAARVFVKDEQLLKVLGRVYAHQEMNRISKLFAKGDLPKAFDPVKQNVCVPQELRDVAEAFVDLQQARHEADYDLRKIHTRSDTLALVEQAKLAFQNWKMVRTTDVSRIYLSCFLLWDSWDRKR